MLRGQRREAFGKRFNGVKVGTKRCGVQMAAKGQKLEPIAMPVRGQALPRLVPVELGEVGSKGGKQGKQGRRCEYYSHESSVCRESVV